MTTDIVGILVTNEHVANGASKVTVLASDGTIVAARVIKVDAANDIAPLKAEG